MTTKTDKADDLVCQKVIFIYKYSCAWEESMYSFLHQGYNLVSLGLTNWKSVKMTTLVFDHALFIFKTTAPLTIEIATISKRIRI